MNVLNVVSCVLWFSAISWPNLQKRKKEKGKKKTRKKERKVKKLSIKNEFTFVSSTVFYRLFDPFWCLFCGSVICRLCLLCLIATVHYKSLRNLPNLPRLRKELNWILPDITLPGSLKYEFLSISMNSPEEPKF